MIFVAIQLVFLVVSAGFAYHARRTFLASRAGLRALEARVVVEVFRDDGKVGTVLDATVAQLVAAHDYTGVSELAYLTGIGPVRVVLVVPDA